MTQRQTEAGPSAAAEQAVEGAVEGAAVRADTHHPRTPGSGEASYAQGLAWATVLVGLWVAICPWVMEIPFGDPPVSNACAGMAVAVLGIVAMSGCRLPVDPWWGGVALGGWITVSTFAFRAAGVGVPSYLAWSDIVAGAVITVLSAIASAWPAPEGTPTSPTPSDSPTPSESPSPSAPPGPSNPAALEADVETRV